MEPSSMNNREKNFPNIYRLLSNATILTSIISVVYSYSFLVTYSFLYGYYFSGELGSPVSNFDIIRVIIPFNLNTISYTFVLLAISTAIIFSIVQVILSKNLNQTVAVIFGFLLFHYLFAAFFTKEISIENYTYLATIWILAFVLSILIVFLNRAIDNPFKALTGILLGSVIGVLITRFINNTTNSLLSDPAIFTMTITFILGLLFTYIPYNKGTIFLLFIFPYSAIVVGIINSFLPFHFTTMHWLISLIIAFFISRKFYAYLVKIEHQKKKTKITLSFKVNIKEIKNTLMNPKTQKFALVSLFLFLLLIFVMIPRMALNTGQLVRDTTPTDEHQVQSIDIISLDGDLITIEGILVTERDNTIYISNKEWELEQIKTTQYIIRD